MKNICPIGLKAFEESFTKKKNLTKTSESQKKEFVKELLSNFSPIHIKPEDDFYDYINYQWLENVSVEKQQDYIVQVDDFRLVQDKVYHDIHDIILEYIDTHKDKLATNLKNFYNSVIDMIDIKRGKNLSLEAVQTVDSFLQKGNVWELLAFINKDEVIAHSAPFTWSLNPDNKDPTVFRSSVLVHRFALVDLSIYYDDGTEIAYKQNYRNQYKMNLLIVPTSIPFHHFL